MIKLVDILLNKLSGKGEASEGVKKSKIPVKQEFSSFLKDLSGKKTGKTEIVKKDVPTKEIVGRIFSSKGVVSEKSKPQQQPVLTKGAVKTSFVRLKAGSVKQIVPSVKPDVGEPVKHHQKHLEKSKVSNQKSSADKIQYQKNRVQQNTTSLPSMLKRSHQVKNSQVRDRIHNTPVNEKGSDVVQTKSLKEDMVPLHKKQGTNKVTSGSTAQTLPVRSEGSHLAEKKPNECKTSSAGSVTTSKETPSKVGLSKEASLEKNTCGFVTTKDKGSVLGRREDESHLNARNDSRFKQEKALFQNNASVYRSSRTNPHESNKALVSRKVTDFSVSQDTKQEATQPGVEPKKLSNYSPAQNLKKKNAVSQGKLEESVKVKVVSGKAANIPRSQEKPKMETAINPKMDSAKPPVCLQDETISSVSKVQESKSSEKLNRKSVPVVNVRAESPVKSVQSSVLKSTPSMVFKAEEKAIVKSDEKVSVKAKEKNNVKEKPQSSLAQGLSNNRQSQYFTDEKGETIENLAVVPTPVEPNKKNSEHSELIDEVAREVLVQSLPSQGQQLQDFPVTKKEDSLRSNHPSTQQKTKQESLIVKNSNVLVERGKIVDRYTKTEDASGKAVQSSSRFEELSEAKIELEPEVYNLKYNNYHKGKVVGMDSAPKGISMSSTDTAEKKTNFESDRFQRQHFGSASRDGSFSNRENSSEGRDLRRFLANSVAKAKDIKAQSAELFEQNQSKVLSGNASVSHSKTEKISHAMQIEAAPLMMEELKKLREGGRSWSRISFKSSGGQEGALHMRLNGDHLVVRVGKGNEELFDALSSSWESLTQNAKELGVTLGKLEFFEELSNSING